MEWRLWIVKHLLEGIDEPPTGVDFGKGEEPRLIPTERFEEEQAVLG